MRIELTTSSLPRKCSTAELQQLNEKLNSTNKKKSGRPGSNRPPSAWKADALPNELLPLNNNYLSVIRNPFVGREGFEPSKSKQQIYSLSHLATLVSPRLMFHKTRNKLKKEPMEGFEPPTS